VGEEQYSATMDVFPQQEKKFNKLFPFYEALKENRFTSTKCSKCGVIKWPPRTLCPECTSDELDWVELPNTGTIDIFTVEEVGVPMGFEAPLVHALVKLDNSDFRIFTRILDVNPEELEIGARVGLKVLDVSRDRVTYAFKPI